jgi:hypothetical protein
LKPELPKVFGSIGKPFYRAFTLNASLCVLEVRDKLGGGLIPKQLSRVPATNTEIQ